jgi:DNA polymerase-3 subunit alpha
MAEGFVHLHNHTEYSMLDGAARVEDMVLAAKADGQSAIAITDHGNLYGVIDFYEACRKHDVTPIIGLEAYMAANSRFDRPPRRGKIDDTGGETEGGQKLYHHLTLLATTNEGYRNLRELSSMAFLEGYYYKPRLDWDLLERYATGSSRRRAVSEASCCRRYCRTTTPRLSNWPGDCRASSGRENFFIELQDHGMPSSTARTRSCCADARRSCARRCSRRTTCTTSAHDDAEMHDALLCIGTGLVGRGSQPLSIPQRPALPEVRRRDALPLSRASRSL